MKSCFAPGLLFVALVLVGCGIGPTSPTGGSTCDPKDRAIIEKEWLTRNGEPRRHNLYPEPSWWHSCSSIDKIELVETTDKGRFYKVIWLGETFGDALPPNPGMGDGSKSSRMGGVEFRGIENIDEAIIGAVKDMKSVDGSGIPLPTTKTIPGGRTSSGLHTSKMYVKGGHIDSVQLEYLRM